MTFAVIFVVFGLILAVFGLVAMIMTVLDMVRRRQGGDRDAVVIAAAEPDLE